ncbi:hypothetical protein PPYR_09202 [Photinus pyralis]|uniref:Uncharacterized protein n=1 Tax=Photinus pyralis TaxID=7054 RepID=A0A5N4ALK8_PHOPY|nr:uncharacterized protein LOC116172113 [Photinus pyralis]KAB0798209.1 hypothetical protein PPYR_09202 [Photinus pyralis]
MNQIILTLGVFLSASSVVQCFNIYASYQVQNQSLFEDILELEASSVASDGDVLSRKRRDYGGTVTVTRSRMIHSRGGYDPCCRADMNQRFNVNWGYVRECYSYPNPKHNVTVHSVRTLNRNSTEFKEKIAILKNDALCQIQCVAHKYDMVDKNGIVVVEGLNKFLSTIYEGTWLAPLAKQIATKCMNEIQTESANFLKTKTANACNPALIALNQCVHREVQLSCPPEHIGNIEACLQRIGAYGRF